MGSDGLGVSDLMAIAKDNDGAFGGNGAWVFFLFFLLAWGGNGFWGNGNRQAATTDDIQNQFNFAALERQNNETVAAVRQVAYDVTGAVKDMGYMNNNGIRDVESMVQQNGYQQSQCCCELNRNMDSVKYDALLNTNAIMKNDCDNTQKILDAISTNRIADMQNQINQLQLQAALCGVVRYPQATTYSAGPNPLYTSTCSCMYN